MLKRIVLCADDYGQAPTISSAILRLVELKRLTAVSCMVNTDCWPVHAKWLIPHQANVDLGLHFNLSAGRALSASYRQAYGADLPSLPSVLCKTIFRQLQQAIIEEEWAAQLDCFIKMTGRLPDFIDGHQHIHQFPIVRQALVAVYQRLGLAPAYVRLVKDKIQAGGISLRLKKMIVHCSGTDELKKLLIRSNIPHNRSFTGMYHFPQSPYYPLFFAEFLRASLDGGLIMCHPGLRGTGSSGVDPIASARFDEYRYLISDQFTKDCDEQGVSLSRGRSILTAY